MGKDSFIGSRKSPIKAIMISKLGLSVETEPTLSAAQLAHLYSLQLTPNVQEEEQCPGGRVYHDQSKVQQYYLTHRVIFVYVIMKDLEAALEMVLVVGPLDTINPRPQNGVRVLWQRCIIQLDQVTQYMV